MILDRIRRFFERHQIGAERIVVACSGGADSTALLLALSEIGRYLVCVHVNHHLRGDESDGDERFVRNLCDQRNIPIIVSDGTIESEAIRHSGIESAARDVRIARLQEVRAGSGFIATAHQKNDQAETIVMRLITGTGLAGLRGIHERRDDGFIRPLIDVTRDEIDAFLAERKVTPRVDRMNADPRFLRNRVRAALRDFGPAAIDNIASVAAQAQELWPQVERSIDAAERDHARVSAASTQFLSWPADPWMRQALLHRHIRRLDSSSRDVSARDLERLASSIDSIQRVSVTKSLELIRRNGALILRRLPQPAEEFEVTVKAGQSVYIPQIGTTVKVTTATQRPSDPATFTIRNRRPKDRYKHKKLKDFLIDRKIAAEERDRIPVLVWNGEIIWVGGLEVANRFEVTGLAGASFEVVLEHEEGKGQDSIQR
ncbi:MAG TPA: tRNA lysidine(34) synthetase TilS [Thermoanaerobaculia bacterium]